MHLDTSVCDQLKNVQNIFEPDQRVRIFGLTIEKYVSWMEMANLNESVPKEIRIQFDIARNTFIYSYYSYYLAMTAQIQAFATLEFAFTKKLENSSLLMKSKPSFSELFKCAIDNDWIDDTALPIRSTGANTAVDSKSRCRALQDYWAPSKKVRELSGYNGRRNQLVHELGSLDIPSDSAEILRTCAGLINHMFRAQIQIKKSEA